MTTGPGAVLAALAAMLLPGAAGPGRIEQIAYVIDGDTFRLASGERVRIAGIDAPETRRGQARCASEFAAGRTATARARVLLDGQMVRLERVGRSYDRTVARARWQGRDLAGELVRRGIAGWWPRGGARPDWCARPRGPGGG